MKVKLLLGFLALYEGEIGFAALVLKIIVRYIQTQYLHLPSYLYLDGSSQHVKCEETYLLQNKYFKITTAIDVNKCLEHIKSPIRTIRIVY